MKIQWNGTRSSDPLYRNPWVHQWVWYALLMFCFDLVLAGPFRNQWKKHENAQEVQVHSIGNNDTQIIAQLIDLDGHMSSSMDLICGCLCFASRNRFCCMHTYIPTVMPTHLHADLHAYLHTYPHIAFTWFCIGRAIEKSSESKKTHVFQNHSTGPSKAQNEWSNTRSMDLDGHMVSSINLICVCLCFASSVFAKSWFPKIDKICKFFLEKGLVPRNLMLGEEKSSARELFSRKKYPPAERPPNYGDKGVFCGKSQILMFFCVANV